MKINNNIFIDIKNINLAYMSLSKKGTQWYRDVCIMNYENNELCKKISNDASICQKTENICQNVHDIETKLIAIQEQIQEKKNKIDLLKKKELELDNDLKVFIEMTTALAESLEKLDLAKNEYLTTNKKYQDLMKKTTKSY